MSNVRIQTNDKEPVEVLAVDANRTPLTGLTNLVLKIRRRSDDFFFDWSDNTFKTGGAVATLLQPLQEVNAAVAPGKYKLNKTNHVNGFDTSSITNPTNDDIYFLTVLQDVAPFNAINTPQIGQLSVGDFVDHLDAFVSNNASPAEVAQELEAIGLDHLVAVSPGATPPAEGSYIDQILDQLGNQPTHVVLQTFSYNQTADRLDVTVWIEKGNMVFNDPPNMGDCDVNFYTKDGVLLFSLTDMTPDAQGIYTASQASPGLVPDALYYAVAQVAVAGVPNNTVSGAKGMFTL